MKRRDFFKRISLGAAAVVVAPSVVKGVSEEVKDQEWIEVDLSDRDIRKYPMTYDEAYPRYIDPQPSWILMSKSEPEAEWLMQFEMDKQFFLGPKA